ncbi:hypothetical protein FPB55_23095 [Pseudomonas sp. BJP69]|nr:hypothetical protein FPB55_23095 [Pseudomonas sp. BJP69]
MVLLEFFWLALQLLSPMLRARAVPSVLSYGKSHHHRHVEATDGLFFIERATVCHAPGATTRTDKAQPPRAIIATLPGVYVQPACNSRRHRTAHPWCATATGSTVTRLAGAPKNTRIWQIRGPAGAGSPANRPAQTQQGRKGWHNVPHSPPPEPL